MYNIYPYTYYNYPHLLAPPSLRTANLPNTRPSRYLNPALWDAVTLGNKTAEAQLQAYMWQTESACNPTRTFTPDSVTTYDYDYDNRLTTVNLPTNSDTVEYTYDATGRRLTKEFTYHNGANTDVTTYKYHYIGSQITEIEINAIRNPGESQTTLRDEEIKIHLGANSQPISYEWVKHISGNTTSATYYYHYDIHGNVLKITDSSENTKITYTYDTLGTILTETNPDSILNFFTFRGASQTIWEPETGMYYSGGYYRPDTGTALQGTGAPVLTNPASSAMLNAVAQATAANAQLAVHAAISASTAGSDSGGLPGGFNPPSGSSDGLVHAGNQGPAMNTASVEPIATVTDGSSSNFFIGGWQKNDYEVHWKVKGSKKSDFKPKDEKSPLIGGGGSLDTGDMKIITKLGFGSDEEEEERDENGRTEKERRILAYHELWDKFPELKPEYVIAGTDEAEAWMLYRTHNSNSFTIIRDANGNITAWIDTDGKLHINEVDENGFAILYDDDKDGKKEATREATHHRTLYWGDILKSISKGYSAIYGSPCTIFMKMPDGDWKGLVFDSSGVRIDIIKSDDKKGLEAIGLSKYTDKTFISGSYVLQVITPNPSRDLIGMRTVSGSYTNDTGTTYINLTIMGISGADLGIGLLQSEYEPDEIYWWYWYYNR